MSFRSINRGGMVILITLGLVLAPFWGVQAAHRFDGDIETPAATETPTVLTATSTLTPASTPSPTDPPTATVTPSPSPTGTPTLTATIEPERIELLVRLKAPYLAESLSPPFSDWSPDVIPELAQLGIITLHVPLSQKEQIIAQLRDHPDVQYVETNGSVQALDTIPNDPAWVNQYNLAAIRAPQGWDLSTGASTVTIAIIDSGVDLAHPDLAAKLVSGYDFVNNDSTPQDDYGHGTHASGIAAASTNNGAGIAGVSWGARIMPVKVLDAGGGGTYANVAAGIIWAVDNHAQVINLSLGGPSPSQVLSDAVTYAANNGVLMVAAAGNSGSGSVLYPAAYPAVLAVAATDGANLRASFSNYGSPIDLAAPGVSIYSLNVGGGYIYRSGTSMAAPHVAGLAAILMALPGANAVSVRSWMESTALDIEPVGWDVYTGSGLIQIDAALRAAMPPTATPTATATSEPVFEPTNTLTVYFGGGAITRTPVPIGGYRTTSTPTVTFTPTQTATPEVTIGTPNPNLSVTPLPPEITVTAQPGNAAGEVSAQSEQADSGNPIPLLCGGLLVILGGILLLLVALRRSKPQP